MDKIEKFNNLKKMALSSDEKIQKLAIILADTAGLFYELSHWRMKVLRVVNRARIHYIDNIPKHFDEDRKEVLKKPWAKDDKHIHFNSLYDRTKSLHLLIIRYIVGKGKFKNESYK